MFIIQINNVCSTVYSVIICKLAAHLAITSGTTASARCHRMCVIVCHRVPRWRVDGAPWRSPAVLQRPHGVAPWRVDGVTQWQVGGDPWRSPAVLQRRHGDTMWRVDGVSQWRVGGLHRQVAQRQAVRLDAVAFLVVVRQVEQLERQRRLVAAHRSGVERADVDGHLAQRETPTLVHSLTTASS